MRVVLCDCCLRWRLPLSSIPVFLALFLILFLPWARENCMKSCLGWKVAWWNLPLSSISVFFFIPWVKAALSESTLGWNFLGKFTWVKSCHYSQFALGEKFALCISLNFVSDFAFSWKVALGESCLEWNLPRVEVSLGGWKFALGEKLPFPGNVVVLSFVLYWVLYFVFFVFGGKLPWVKVVLGRIYLFLSNLFCFLFLVHGKLPWVKVALGSSLMESCLGWKVADSGNCCWFFYFIKVKQLSPKVEFILFYRIDFVFVFCFVHGKLP